MLILTLFILILFALFIYRDTIAVNVIVFLTVMRGIISTNCKWFKVSDSIEDTTGVDLYHKIKKYNKKIYPLNIMSKTVHLITDIDLIKQVLDNSPFIFGVGKFKYNFFKSFMHLNVGVSNGCLWHKRRIINEDVLDTDKKHRHLNIYENIIIDILRNKLPTNYSQFTEVGKLLAMNIVFGVNYIYQPIFDMFSESNSFESVIFDKVDVSNELRNNYFNFMKNSLKNPRYGSLIYLSKQFDTNEEEILHQIPHWIFPIAGTFSNVLPKLLLLLFSHKSVLKTLINKIISNNHHQFIRYCILEVFRLNNPVNSTFRTLLKDYSFNANYVYKKDDQFLILNNPVMRDPAIFDKPNEYNPYRWSKELEDSYYALMFNQGPQRCPGREFIISLISIYVAEYLKSIKNIPTVKVNKKYIPQMIDPCSISFDLDK